MTRRPDLPCAVCGGLMVRTRGSLPEGRATCLTCRRAAWGLGPDESVAVARRAAQKPQVTEQCRACDAPVDRAAGRRCYCSAECFRRRRNQLGRGPRGKTAARGYGYEHQRLRAATIAAAYGTPCVLCGEVMAEGDELHLDHTEDRTAYRGWAHGRCNRLDGARRGGAAFRARVLSS